MKLYILEGPDGSGKSTLARELGVKHRAVTMHQGPFNYDPVYETFDRILSVEHHDVAIFDRAHMGELVYGPIFRGGVMSRGVRKPNAGMYRERIIRLNRWIAQVHELVHVLCLPPCETVEANWSGSPQMFDVKLARRVWDEYHTLSCHFTHVYDYTEDTFNA